MAKASTHKARVTAEQMSSYVVNEQQFLAAIEEGRRALREGKVVDHESVAAAFERIIKLVRITGR